MYRQIEKSTYEDLKRAGFSHLLEKHHATEYFVFDAAAVIEEPAPVITYPKQQSLFGGVVEKKAHIPLFGSPEELLSPQPAEGQTLLDFLRNGRASTPAPVSSGRLSTKRRVQKPRGKMTTARKKEVGPRKLVRSQSSVPQLHPDWYVNQHKLGFTAKLVFDFLFEQLASNIPWTSADMTRSIQTNADLGIAKGSAYLTTMMTKHVITIAEIPFLKWQPTK